MATAMAAAMTAAAMASMEGNGKRAKLSDAAFPRDAPAKGETGFLSIVIGSQALVWAWHHGANGSFSPSLFWTTPHLGPEDLSMRPCYALHRFLATPALRFVFGDHVIESATPHAAHEAAVRRKVPTLSVYVVSANDDAAREREVEHLFGEVPARLVRLRNGDFFSSEQGMTPSMRTDRLAALYACRADYNVPVLFVNAGAALSYSALDEDGKLMGGGVSPGLSVRFRSLFDYCGTDDAIPSIEYDAYRDAVNRAMAEKVPIPLFSNDPTTGIIAGVVSELSGLLRNVIKQFLRQARHRHSTDGDDSGTGHERADRADPNVKGVENGGGAAATRDRGTVAGDPMEEWKRRQPMTVVISGNDAEVLKPLLKDGCSNIVEVEPGVTFPPASAATIVYRKNMALYGIEHLLLDKIAKAADPDPDEELRQRIVGLRAAKGVTSDGERPVLDSVYRGTVLRVIPGKTFEDDMFQVVYDDDACRREFVDLVGLYDLLALYAEVGEKSKERNQEHWAEEKLGTSKAVQADMERNPKVKNRKAELEAAMAKDGSIASVVAEVVAREPKAKKRKTSDAASKLTIPNPKDDPQGLVGSRVAKYFGKELFFGTIRNVINVEDNPDDNPDEVWWNILYDDDDSEDMDEKQLRKALMLYQKKAANDTRRKKKKVGT